MTIQLSVAPVLIAAPYQVLVNELRPFVMDGDRACYMDDDALWATMRNLGGLSAIRSASKEICTAAVLHSNTNPDGAMLAGRIRLGSLRLCWITIPCCWLEARACRLLPDYPRSTARSLAYLLVTLGSILQAMP